MIIAHGDLDGFVGALIGIEHAVIIPDRVHMFSYSPDRDRQWEGLLSHQISPDRKFVDDIEDVWFIDISLRPGELEWARGYEKKGIWRWVDHHRSSENFDAEGIFHEVIMETSGNHCAADLMWKMYHEGALNPNGYLNAWQYIARDRDLWLREFPELGQKLDILVKHVSREKAWLPLLLAEAAQTNPNILVNNHQDLWEMGMAEYETSCQLAKGTAHRITIEGIPFVFAHVSYQESDVSMTLYDEDQNEVIIMLVNRPDTVGASLRTLREDIDLSVLAKAVFGGGGHHQAAGGRLKKKHLNGGFSAISKDIKAWIVKQEKEMTKPKEEPAPPPKKPVRRRKIVPKE